MTITGSRLPASSLLGCDVGRPGRQHLEPLAAERQFFKALLEADGPELDRVLADDFLLIDVLSGSEFQKPTLLAAVASCQPKFVTNTEILTLCSLFSFGSTLFPTCVD